MGRACRRRRDAQVSGSSVPSMPPTRPTPATVPAGFEPPPRPGMPNTGAAPEPLPAGDGLHRPPLPPSGRIARHGASQAAEWHPGGHRPGLSGTGRPYRPGRVGFVWGNRAHAAIPTIHGTRSATRRRVPHGVPQNDPFRTLSGRFLALVCHPVGDRTPAEPSPPSE